MRIGFIGMGIMGQPMAKNLLKAGHEVMVYNRTRKKVLPLVGAGAQLGHSPRELAHWAKAVILMLTGPEAIEAVLNGSDGLLSAFDAKPTIINMSTVSPAYTRELASKLHEKDIPFIDAPVSGSKKPAEDGTLVILASGPHELVRAMEPMFLVMGKKLVYCGDAGRGTDMKMSINLLLSVMMAGLSEAVVMAERLGLDTQLFLDTVLSGPLSCDFFRLKAPMLQKNEFPPQFPLKHMAKDINFILQAAQAKGLRLQVEQAVADYYETAMDNGLEDLDLAAIKRVI
ncbi:MAG: NAD(P)-dependent oxidoreductase [Dissulfuribacterales bacterium]